MLLLLRTCASARVAAPGVAEFFGAPTPDAGLVAGCACTLPPSGPRCATMSSAFSTGIRTLPLALSTQP